MNNKFVVISDVDGVLTDGGFYYTSNGKVIKKFGTLDSDAVKFLKWAGIDVYFITSDITGFDISNARIKDMGCDLNFCKKPADRYEFIKKAKQLYGHDNIVFIGDEYIDGLIADKLDIAFACPHSDYDLSPRGFADYESERTGANGAFFDIAEWVVERFTDKCYGDYVEEKLNIN